MNGSDVEPFVVVDVTDAVGVVDDVFVVVVVACDVVEFDCLLFVLLLVLLPPLELLSRSLDDELDDDA